MGGKTLTAARKAAKLTLAQAAKKASLSQALLRQLEDGSIAPRPHELVALAAAYKTTPDNLSEKNKEERP